MKIDSFNFLKFMLLLTWLYVPVTNAEIDFSTEVGVEQRHFWENPAFPGQLNQSQTSAFIQPEISWSAEEVNFKINFSGFYRWDDRDTERDHGDIRELYALYQANSWDFLVGIQKVFWGVTESRHLVDVINQNDNLEDIDQEDKLGQPMINLSGIFEWGQVSIFLLPRFRTLDFPGNKGRFRGPFQIDDDPIYESSDGNQNLDWAIRTSQVLGNVDLGISYFDGTSREARFTPSTDPLIWKPAYDLMKQTGIDAQYTGEVWLLKWEAAYRETQIDAFSATVLGAEYTFYQISNSAADLGILAEYLWDGRHSTSPVTSFDHDLFFGGRYTFNDTQDTQLLGGFIIDTRHQHTLLTLEAERRLGTHFSLELTIRASINESTEDPLFFTAQDDHMRISLSWFY